MEAPRLFQAPEGTFDTTVRSSMTIMELLGRLYRIEFWPDARWVKIPEAERPRAQRSHSDDGWFLITPMAQENLPYPRTIRPSLPS